jgi:putative sterol carrier protein
MTSITDIFKTLEGRNPWLQGITGTCRFDLTDDGKWLVIITDGVVRAEQRPGEADGIMRCSSADFRGMVDGSVHAVAAVIQGKFEVTGDLAMIMRATRIFAVHPGQSGGTSNG